MSDADADHARRAAAAVAAYDTRLATMDSRLVAMQADIGSVKTSLHWVQVVLGVQLALILALVGKLFLGGVRP